MASEEEEVARLCQSELIPLVEAMMSPLTLKQQRFQAYEKLEHFKQTSPLLVQCGLTLATKHSEAAIRHFGLKVLEDVIKLRWNEMSLEQKVFIKDNAMKLIDSNTDGLHLIKDAISR